MQPVVPIPKSAAFRTQLLAGYAQLVGYRHVDFLVDPSRTPQWVDKMPFELVRSKASTSLNAAGIFLAISVAVLVAVMSSDVFARAISGSFGWLTVASALAALLPLVLIVRKERVLSAPYKDDETEPASMPSKEAETKEYLDLVSYLAAAGLVIFTIPFVLRTAFLLAGLSLIVAATLFLFAAVELYDYASGWSGGTKKRGVRFRFHLAGIASHSYLFGISFALLGTALLLVQISPWVATMASVLVLLALLIVPEVERGLYRTKNATSDSGPPKGDKATKLPTQVSR